MSPTNHFDRDWLDCTALFQPYNVQTQYLNLKVNLNKDFFENLRLDVDSCARYRIEAATKCAITLGDNIALCISGGVDSQAMLHSFIDSGIKFTAYTFVYNNELNKFDVDIARKYCAEHYVNLIEIPFDVISFLSRDNYDIGMKYKSASPHFNVHYKFCDILRERGHTGICFGGITPYRSRTNWGNNFVKNCLNYITYSELENFPVQGSFLSFYPELTWAIALLTPMTDINVSHKMSTWRETELSHNVRYANKILGYVRAGLDIYESKKYTGFEEVKLYYKNLTKDGLEFEKQFRIPLENQLIKVNTISQFQFDDGIEELLTFRMNH